MCHLRTNSKEPHENKDTQQNCMQCTAVPSVTALKEEINVQLYRKLGRFIAAQYL